MNNLMIELLIALNDKGLTEEAASLERQQDKFHVIDLLDLERMLPPYGDYRRAAEILSYCVYWGDLVEGSYFWALVHDKLQGGYRA